MYEVYKQHLRFTVRFSFRFGTGMWEPLTTLKCESLKCNSKRENEPPTIPCGFSEQNRPMLCVITTAMILLSNVVAVCDIGMELDLRKVVDGCRNTQFDPGNVDHPNFVI